jgi:hypothetical protein
MAGLFRIYQNTRLFNSIISSFRPFLFENIQTLPIGKFLMGACCFHGSNIVPSAVNPGGHARIDGSKKEQPGKRHYEKVLCPDGSDCLGFGHGDVRLVQNARLLL